MTAINQVLPLLKGVKQTSNGWTARCPVHDDKSASLSVAIGDEGRVLFHCHAGCATESIVEVLGLEMSDLFDDDGEPAPQKTAMRKPPRVFASLKEATRGASGVWTYTDAEGNAILWVARYDRDGGKDFLPFHPTNAGIACGDPPGPLPLYQLPVLANTTTVYFVEGEKAADVARSIGLTATTSAHGARSAKTEKHDWSVLAGKKVVVLPDNDEPGRYYATDVATILTTMDEPAMVRILDLPGLPAKGDIVEFIEARDSRTSEQICTYIEALASEVATFAPTGTTANTDKSASEDTDDDKPKRKQSDELVDLAFKAGVQLWHDHDARVYATIPVADHAEHYELKTKAFRRWLARLFYDSKTKAPSSQALAVNNHDARTRRAGDLQGALDEIARLEEELRIKNGRIAMIDAHRRPYYRPIERMAILELKAARGWSQAESARRFLVKPTTIASWLKRIDESSKAPLVQIREPVNKFPDLVRYVVRRVKVLFPSMGRKRIAQTLTRAGLHLSASTVGRMLKDRDRDPKHPTEADAATKKHTAGRTVTAKRPNHVWHVDLTVVPAASGFWAPWVPLALPQVWPFCWWIAFAVDHYSRVAVGFAVFKKQPSSAAVRAFLGRTIAKVEACPKYIVCDQGMQFTSTGFKAWCKRKQIRPRYGAVHKYGSIAVIERFIKSLKDEWLWRLTIPLRVEAMRKELSVYTCWFNEHRPHQALDGCTPREIYEGVIPLCQARRFDLRPTRTAHQDDAISGLQLTLAVTYYEGRRRLPIIELKRAA